MELFIFIIFIIFITTTKGWMDGRKEGRRDMYIHIVKFDDCFQGVAKTAFV